VFLPYTDLGYREGQCHVNVLHRVRMHGGKRLNGWIIWECMMFAEAEFHCVWQTSGALIDITPRRDGEEQILFLPDPATRLTKGERGIMQPTNRLSTGGYSIMGLPYRDAIAPNALNQRTREYCEELGIDPFAVCEDEGLASTNDMSLTTMLTSTRA
jgi:hypothetical protein